MPDKGRAEPMQGEKSKSKGLQNFVKGGGNTYSVQPLPRAPWSKHVKIQRISMCVNSCLSCVESRITSKRSGSQKYKRVYKRLAAMLDEGVARGCSHDRARIHDNVILPRPTGSIGERGSSRNKDNRSVDRIHLCTSPPVRE